MFLEDIIDRLSKADQSKVIKHGFNNPHSYRGYYDELAFEPAENVTVAEMLASAQSALGTTFEGWKGGEYTMSRYTPCWIAMEGSSQNSDKIGPMLLSFILGEM